jgi:PIN domain nuclease of toxin-antitoxin system
MGNRQQIPLGQMAENAGIGERSRRHHVRARLRPLPLSLEHARHAGTLRGPHRDPFDRLLAAQAEIEDIPLVTADPAFRYFNVRTLW